MRLHTAVGLTRGTGTSREGSWRWDLGLCGTVLLGAAETRLGCGLRAQRRLSSPIALHALLGPVWSSCDAGRGVQTRLGLRIGRSLSVTGLWQRLSYEGQRSSDGIAAGSAVSVA
ncbi:MAG: hypothetical protein GF330_06470 [Candidatus Eisenbacteria bacterium]|nr:hypothetical protein [Candidatus Eisenbacteria bacterium]